VRVTALRVRTVAPLDGRRVRLGLTDGTERVVDLAPFLRGPVFAKVLADDAHFRTVRVDTELGTIVWPDGADLCPDVLVHRRTPAQVERVAEEP
jgi:hypothetical protein